MASFGQKLLATFQTRGQLCIGIDPSSQQLNSWGLPDSASGARTFSLELLDAASSEVGIIKPQVAFFEQFGPEGMRVLVEVLQQAQAQGLLVIADAKRGDIGSTMAAYSRAWLSKEAVFVCDALTVSPYLGTSTLDETVQVALENDRGVFALSATSNPEASTLQSAKRDNRSVAASVVDYAASFGTRGLGSIGVVLGATVDGVRLGIELAVEPSFPVLVPGFGAQGAKLADVKKLLRAFASYSICSVSRSVAGGSPVGLQDRVAAAKSELEIGLRA